MLDHPEHRAAAGRRLSPRCATPIRYDQLVFTGPIDEYFGYRFGKLPYRSLRFRHETLDSEWFQPVAVGQLSRRGRALHPHHRIQASDRAGRADDQHHLRISERPRAIPIIRSRAPENQALFKRYEALADAEPDVTFVGRLATYRYYNMDQVVGQALATYRKWAARRDAAVEQVSVAAA